MRSVILCRITLAITLFVISGHCANAQLPPPANAPSVKFTDGPAALVNNRGIVCDVQWADCVGIAKVRIIIVDKATKVVLKDSSFNTTVASSSKQNWQHFLLNSKANDVVQVTVYVLNANNAAIASTNTVEVKLN